MSKAAKQSIFILIGLLVVSLGYGGYILMEKLKLEETKAHLEGQLEQANAREKKSIAQIRNLQDDKKSLEGKLDVEQKTVTVLRQKVQDVESEMNSLKSSLESKVSRLENERDGWKNRVDRISQERDDLLAQVQRLKVAPPPPPATPPARDDELRRDTARVAPRVADSDEEYWAEILRKKTQLEVEVDNLKAKISEDSIEIVELKQKNQQLELKIDALESDKEDVERQIQDKSEIVNRLSLELARAKNDKKYEESRLSKLKSENLDLRRQMRDLVSAKNALEKSIIRLTQDKVKMEKKLGQSETIIQSKIDEIWEIKESIDESFKQSKVEVDTSNEVELPPIVVKTGGSTSAFPTGMTHAGFNGRVVSINDENNFVIVDIGETQGLRLGDGLSVYRDSKYVARLEVIQVRKDIAAADIKDQWARVRVGDVVR